jgi:undecaprenyl diphosphate synthase
MDKKNKAPYSNVPRHVAIIMDGNGRWAAKHSMSRSDGHKRGAEVIEPLLDKANELGVEAVSLYAFSTENWKRPASEIKSLWNLLAYFFSCKMNILMEKDVKVIHSGFTTKLPVRVKNIINNVVQKTSQNKGVILNLCINYGGKQEIIYAINNWFANKRGKSQLTEKKFEKYLFTYGLPEIDLLIRTGGEFRISNFLLWQIAYSEIIFMDVLWPDFDPDQLQEAVDEYNKRKRRFGGI